MNIKPRFVEGLYLDCDDAVCWRCMTETEYLASELGEYADPPTAWPAPIFYYSESDSQAYCVRCGEKIEHSLTDDGRQ